MQLAKIRGVECIVTVGNDEEVQFCERFGAMNYRTEKFAERVLENHRIDYEVSINAREGTYQECSQEWNVARHRKRRTEATYLRDIPTN